ncbi:MAG: AarF/ABC1/UbiB kinase family protein [Chloroflexota bacterium]|nr:AarF/ABC1/UbiB kinase family protein [Chloroflexota bacterium]
MSELMYATMRFLLFRGPVIMAWTSLPILKNSTPPYPDLAEVMSPISERSALVLGGGIIEPDAWTRVNTRDEADAIINEARSKATAKPWYKALVGRTIRGLVAELGPTFIKFAQILSMRPEVPPFLREELQILQDRLPPLKYNDVKEALERELGKPMEKVFDWVEEKPVASASLGVVHHGRLRTGEEVALKIQRPHLKGTVKLDVLIVLNILLPIVSLFLPLFRRTDLGVFTVSFRESLDREIDFLLEGRIQDQMRLHFQTHPVYRNHIKVAKVYFEHTTTKLLTMEFVHGFFRLDHLAEEATLDEIFDFVSYRIPEYPDDEPFHLFYILPLFLGDMMYKWGFYHGDLHLGNLYLMRPDNNGNSWRWFLCDFGMFQDCTIPEVQRTARQIFIGLGLAGTSDNDYILDLFKKVCLARGTDITKIDWDSAAESIRHFARRRHIPEENAINDEAMAMGSLGIVGRGRLHGTQSYVTEVMYTLVPQLVSEGARLPYYVWLIVKCFAYIEESVQTLYGGMDYVGIFSPHLRRYVLEDVEDILEVTNWFTLEDSLPEVIDQFWLTDRDRAARVVEEVLGDMSRPPNKIYNQVISTYPSDHYTKR